jgi:hypothetical protein
MWLLMSCGRAGVGHIRYVFPKGFAGEFSIAEDPAVKSRLVRKDGVMIVEIPPSGEIQVSPEDYKALSAWSHREWVFSDGTPIHDVLPGEAFPSGNRIVELRAEAVTVRGMELSVEKGSLLPARSQAP